MNNQDICIVVVMDNEYQLEICKYQIDFYDAEGSLMVRVTDSNEKCKEGVFGEPHCIVVNPKELKLLIDQDFERYKEIKQWFIMNDWIRYSLTQVGIHLNPDKILAIYQAKIKRGVEYGKAS